MPVDEGADMAQRAAVALGAAVKAALRTEGVQQKELAERVGEDPAKISRLINGSHGDVTLGFVRRVEDALALPTGHLLRAGGFVDEPSTTREAVLADPDLETDQKTTLLAVYDSLVQVADQLRSRERRRRR